MSPELVQAQENIELARNFNHRNFLQNPSGTPLSCAIRSGSLELIRFLIEHGAVIEQMDFDGLLPLQLSISLGKARIPVSELFRAHYNQSLPNGLSVATTQNLLYWAAYSGSTDMVDWVISHYGHAAISPPAWHPLNAVLLNGDINMAALMVGNKMHLWEGSLKPLTPDEYLCFVETAIGMNQPILLDWVLTAKGYVTSDLKLRFGDDFIPYFPLLAIQQNRYEIFLYYASLFQEPDCTISWADTYQPLSQPQFFHTTRSARCEYLCKTSPIHLGVLWHVSEEFLESIITIPELAGLIDVKDNLNSLTPLETAIVCCNVHATQRLMEFGAELNNINLPKIFELMFISKSTLHGHLTPTFRNDNSLMRTLDWILGFNCMRKQLNNPLSNGQTPLEFSVSNGFDLIVQIIRKNGVTEGRRVK
jgi:ankyrin repeat protein